VKSWAELEKGMSSKNMMVIMIPAFLFFTLLMVFSNFIP
jgi:hypothetical protein